MILEACFPIRGLSLKDMTMSENKDLGKAHLGRVTKKSTGGC